jgi:hypothetical protein
MQSSRWTKFSAVSEFAVAIRGAPHAAVSCASKSATSPMEQLTTSAFAVVSRKWRNASNAPTLRVAVILFAVGSNRTALFFSGPRTDRSYGFKECDRHVFCNMSATS